MQHYDKFQKSGLSVPDMRSANNLREKDRGVPQILFFTVPEKYLECHASIDTQYPKSTMQQGLQVRLIFLKQTKPVDSVYLQSIHPLTSINDLPKEKFQTLLKK
jgi:hypothetical protein